MPVETVNRKPKAYFAVVNFLVMATVMILTIHYAETLAREAFDEFDELKYLWWVLSLVYVLGFIFIYNLFFGTEGRRRRRVFACFCLSGVLCIALFQAFWWGVLVALGVMLAVLLAGQRYIERDAPGGQHNLRS
jgi:lysylphosphatidylglycerol synthetase-like protein (DUF2156 family)